MKLSIVMLAYNQREFLAAAIESVIAQRSSSCDVELIVIDPMSNDGSSELLSAYDRHIDLCIREPDQGPSDGLNKGFASSTGDIFAFLNADDFYLPGAAQTMLRKFEEYPTVDVLIGDGYKFDQNRLRFIPIISSGSTIERFESNSFVFLQQSMFFRRSAFALTDGFNLANRTSWDGELVADMLYAGATFRNVHRYLSVFRIHDASITGSGRLNDQYQLDVARIRSRIIQKPSVRVRVSHRVRSKLTRYAIPHR